MHLKDGHTSKVYLVLPAYNEGAVIQETIKEIKEKTNLPIIVVDDGSRDNTYKQLKQISGITVVQHIINRGKGAAVKTGIEAAKLLDADYVITMDADGQHDPEDVKKIAMVLKTGTDVVLGSRLMNVHGMPITRIILNKVSNILAWLAYGIWVTDSLSGFRGYSRKALDVIDTKRDTYEFDSEVIKEIKRNNLKYIEIPIRVRYTKHSLNKKDRVNLKTAIKITLNMFRPD